MVYLNYRDVIGPATPGLTPVAEGGIDWITVVIAISGSSLLGGLIALVVGGLRAAAASRRDGYAEAVAVLIARAEFPYRVRRRTSDDPQTLAALATAGSDLQERLAASRIWVASESQHIGEIFERARAAIDADIFPFVTEAWQSPPIGAAAEMNLGGWGPPDPWQHLQELEQAVAGRFGWRRVRTWGRA